jgi:hypothetical protein
LQHFSPTRAEKKRRILRHASCTFLEKPGIGEIVAMKPTSSSARKLNNKPSAARSPDLSFLIEANELILRAEQLGRTIKERVRQTVGLRDGGRDKDEVEPSGKQL